MKPFQNQVKYLVYLQDLNIYQINLVINLFKQIYLFLNQLTFNNSFYLIITYFQIPLILIINSFSTIILESIYQVIQMQINYKYLIIVMVKNFIHYQQIGIDYLNWLIEIMDQMQVFLLEWLILQINNLIIVINNFIMIIVIFMVMLMINNYQFQIIKVNQHVLTYLKQM